MKSLKNIGATGGDSVVIRTAGKRNFAARAPDPGAAFSEAASDFEFKCGSELSMGRELPYFFKFAISVPIVGQGNVDRRFQMKLLLLRDPGFRKERLIELHKSLELECGRGLHHKRDYRRESKNPITARRSTGGIEFSLESGGVTKNTLGMNDVSDPALEA